MTRFKCFRALKLSVMQHERLKGGFTPTCSSCDPKTEGQVFRRAVLTVLSSWISSVYLSCSSLGLPSGRPHSRVTQDTPALTRRGANGRAGRVPMV